MKLKPTEKISGCGKAFLNWGLSGAFPESLPLVLVKGGGQGGGAKGKRLQHEGMQTACLPPSPCSLCHYHPYFFYLAPVHDGVCARMVSLHPLPPAPSVSFQLRDVEQAFGVRGCNSSGGLGVHAPKLTEFRGNQGDESGLIPLTAMGVRRKIGAVGLQQDFFPVQFLSEGLFVPAVFVSERSSHPKVKSSRG